MFDPLSFASFLGVILSSGGDGSPQVEVTVVPQAEEIAPQAEEVVVPSGAHAEFFAGAAACAAFLDSGDVAVFEGDEPARQIIPGASMSVFFPKVGNDHRFVIAANGAQPEARQCTGTGAASPDWAAFQQSELAVLKPILAQYQLVELQFPADPVLFANCGADPANIYFIFSPGGPGGVVFAGNSGAGQAESFCNLYEPKE